MSYLFLKILPKPTYGLVGWAISSGWLFGTFRARGFFGIVSAAILAAVSTAAYIAYMYFA